MDRQPMTSPILAARVWGRRPLPTVALVLLALLVAVALAAGPRASAFAQEPVPTPPADRRADLGDAPDSLSNHHGKVNTAYTGVPGRFPTVFQGTPAGEGRGPLHHATDQVWLGDKITQEAEADIGPDADGLNNILANGNDNADNDEGDDGWLNRGKVRFPDCGETELIVRVRKNPSTQQSRVYLNVWFDGNRDGDWDDQGRCEPDGRSNEWIVQNFAIDLTAFSGDYADIRVKTALILNTKPDQPAWIRFTLSDEQAAMPPQTPNNPEPVPDGRGPDNGYNIGETEDYLVRFTDVPPLDIRIDLGDAPDSTNHHGLAQEAYPGVPARFPTVWDVAGPDVSGPRHANATIVWLGKWVTFEKDADLLPDMDGVTNITDNGTDPGSMDKDRADDGWLNRDTTRFLNCRPQKLHVRISEIPVSTARVYLNVYFDGNRDGTWGQRKPCVDSPAADRPEDFAHEWIVQNYLIDTSTFTGTTDLWIPTLPVLNEKDQAKAWVRFMLSETPVSPLAPFQHDGRGPQAPAMWQLGETEDYLWQPPVPPQDEAKPDLGDAPDNTNHHGLAQEAYPGVPARFPTVWDVAGPDVSGPLHRNSLPIHLGYRVSGEKDADQMPDEDGVTNITDNGADVGAMDKDEYDDGWLRMKETRFVDCQETRLRVRISNLALPSTPNGRRMFLNVWFDGNRNGQWGERRACVSPTGENRPDTFAHEWIVQNFVVLVPGVPSVQEIVVPTLKVLNEKPQAAAWVRFTLSEEPIKPLAPFQHDGRGPQAPAMWQLGETEDYLYVPPFDQGEPGQVRATKTSSADGQEVGLGDVFTYTIQIEHVGGSVPINLNMVDPLPAEVIPVGPPSVQELQPTVQTGLLQYNGAAGPSGTVLWKGNLSPNAKVAIHIPVKVRRCPSPQSPEIVNKALVLKADATQLAQMAHRLKVREKCPGTPPEAILEKRIVRDQEVLAPQEPGGAQPSVIEVLQGQEFGYELVLRTQNLPGPQAFVITDTLPVGLVATGVKANAGEAMVEDNGRGVRWKVRLGPDQPTARLRIRVKPTEQVQCGSSLANVAYWAALVGDEVVARGKSNPAVIVLVCADLGDAPDSTNHHGVDMFAYPGVKAQFPTVFDPATGADQGPKHLITWPVRLGKGVTEELDADVGPDADPTNNILPKAGRSNLDERDDGLVRSRLSFQNCRVATIPVAVTIDPRFLSMLPDNQEAVGYLNVWLDSNRDGAWDDTYQCPAPESSQPVTGWEHIVVDYKIDVRALGPGVHIIPVPTNWPVSWPQKYEKAPAWLRITLSERPSNKVLDCGAGTCYIGDGRGYSQPFRFGETEDYLYRQERPDEPPTEGMDPTVEKRGQLRIVHDPRTGSGEWRASWFVKYRNQGSATATQVVITDTLSGPQTLLRERSVPNLPHGEIDSSHVYTVGTLAPGAGGVLFLETSLSLDLAPGTVITNQVTIAAAYDDDLTNNTAVVTLTVPLLPPVITYPTPSTVCTGTFTVTGRAQPGTTVELTIQDAGGTTVVTATVTPDSNGRWSYPVSGLADGEYDITAVAKFGSQTSTATTVRVIVDSTLFWDPSSLRFEDENGRVVLPRDSNGRMDGSGWRVFLRRNTTYTVSVRICCSDPNAQVTLDLGDETLTLTDPDGDRVYSATFITPKTGPIQGDMRLCVVCNLIKVCSDGQITIDPEGTVFDILTGQAVDAAQVACLVQEVSDAGGLPNYTLWPAGDFDQVNPQTTGNDGYFSFFTPPGTYQLQVNKEGYQPYRSPDLIVVDAPVHYDVPLTPNVAEEPDVQILITDKGFEPSVVTVAPGAVIEFINASSTLRGARSITPTAEYTGPSRLKSTDAFDSGLLASGESYKRKLTTEGTYTYVDPSNPTVSGSIIVQQTATTEQKIFLPAVSR